MRMSLRRVPLVVLVSMMLSATAYADGRGNKQPSLGGPIFDITHVDVIPATVNGIDFQQTAYAALFKYRDASQHDQGLESFRVVNWVLAANHAQIIDVWDSLAALNRHLAQRHSVDSEMPCRCSLLRSLRTSIAALAARSMIASTAW
jgi:hypothetical protein